MKIMLHVNARKVNYYVRMFVNELTDEVDFVIKNSSSHRRLTKLLNVDSDNPTQISAKLKEMRSEKNDDVLCDHLKTFLSSLPNTNLSSDWMSELTRCVRVPVPDDKVPWNVDFGESDYKPAMFTAWSVLHTTLDPSSPKPPWADEDFTLMKKEDIQHIKFNALDELHGKKIDRRSRQCKYLLNPETGLPQNPSGRTGMVGRGLLGRFGPNLAADPIVSRWKKLKDGSTKKIQGKKVLECVFIQRRDNEEWALPGGMVEPGLEISMTLVKEFKEEALNVCHNDNEKANEMTNMLKETLFAKGTTIYEGYVDDPRNTDNAWMETVAKNFHDTDGITYKFQLEGGDDAFNSKWQECSASLKLYASHTSFIEKTVKKLGAYW